MSHANRGMQLEKTIKKLFEHYEQLGIWCHKLEVPQAGDGSFIAKSPFDFLIYYNTVLFAFDTKNCKKGSMAIHNFKLHQVKALSDVERNGGDAFFLVYYEEHKALCKFPIKEIRQMIEKDAKSVAYDEDRKIKLDLLGIL